jgi:hypothetical protein
LVLIGVLFGGFYAYQHRNSTEVAAPISPGDQNNANTAPVEPSPVAEHANSEPASGNLKEEKQPVATSAPVLKESAKKIEKAVKKNKVGEAPADADEEPDTNAGDHTVMPVTPEAPEVFIPNTPRSRTLPDGTTITPLPDGRRIVTSKDGTVRVFPSRPRFLRRRRVN